MRILVLSDIHGRLNNLKALLEQAKKGKIGLVLITGDLTNLGERKQAEEVLELLKGLKVLAIPGNFDTEDVLGVLEEKGISLHGKKMEFQGIEFAGFGGGLIGHVGEVMSSEQEIKKGLEGIVNKKTILLTHLPPKNTNIDLAKETVHAGSQSVREIIEEKQPRLHLCGHIHEAFGEEKIGKTLSINIGSVKEGIALLLDIGDETKWERLRL